MASEFFIVDRDVFLLACEQGLNAAVSYLIMARGTQGNNRTTKWSANAVADHAGITRARAKSAIDELIGAGIVELISPSGRPQYKLHLPDSDNGYLYLPNSIVDGVGNEIPPVERVRQTRSIANLKVFILLYEVQDLDNSGGLPADMFDDSAADAETLYQNDTMRLDVVSKHTYTLSLHWYARSSIFSLIGMDFNDYKASFDEIRDMGLLSVRAKVFDSPELDGEIIGSTWGYNYIEELDIAVRRKRKNLAKWPASGHYLIIPAHIKNTDVRCVGVMAYRAQTSKTARWHSIEERNQERMARLYQSALSLEQAKAIERQ